MITGKSEPIAVAIVEDESESRKSFEEILNRAAQLIAAVKDVIGGGAPMTSNIARKVVGTFKKPVAPSAKPADDLTPKETQVLEYLAQGYLYKEIADVLKTSHGTVCTHIEHIYEKLHVRSRSQAIMKYAAH